MAELRLIEVARRAALLAIAVTACRSSAADPGSGVTPPNGWSALPQLATAAGTAAKQTGITVDHVEAWGEPARGCYAAYLGFAGAVGPADVVAQQMVASLSAEPALAGIVIHDVVKPGGSASGAAGMLELAFERAQYHGKLRANIGADGHVRVLACFWNQREPAACEQGCTSLLGSLP